MTPTRQRTVLITVLLLGGLPLLASASATLYLRPASGTFTVGSTFELGIYLNTGGFTVNAVRADLSFPSDKLQVVSPTIGQSLVSFWAVPPTYSNAEGTVSLQGGIPPPGINTADGLLTSVVFRVVGIGRAAVSIRDESRVYAADGKGTDVLGNRSDGVFSLTLPPPLGPLVVAPQHPDPNRWYRDDNVEFVWELPKGATSVSYTLSPDPLDIPDDIPEGSPTSAFYGDLPSGVHYFHIKALNPKSGWGGVSHFVVRVDAEPPAIFPIEVSPRPRTTVRRPTLLFPTTDAHSGLSHYTLKVVRLDHPEQAGEAGTTFFIEVVTPYVLPELAFGTYEVIVRAYDLAGNVREASQKVKIVQAFFRSIGPDGVNIRSNLTLPWRVVYTLGGIAALFVFYLAHFAYRRHREVERKLALGVFGMIEHRISRHLATLREKREEFDRGKLRI